MVADRLQKATLGGGCFWCLEAVYRELQGVESVVSGYAGGRRENPSYAQVCSGATGHAEVVQLDYDPAVIGYRDLLEVFFTIHDPTTPNRQGNDVGTQYRSIVLYHDEEQRQIAEQVLAEQQGQWNAPVVTELVPLERFYPAEIEHQEYYARNPGQPYCQLVVAPKLDKFRRRFAARRRSGAAQGME